MSHVLRTSAVLLTTSALLGLPAVSQASAPTGASSAATPSQRPLDVDLARSRANTRVHFLAFDHTVFAGRKMRVRGQVLARARGRTGALAGARVVLLRKGDGQKRFHRVRATHTGHGTSPRFRFVVKPRRNARYRVVFQGNKRAQRDAATTRTGAYRVVTGKRLKRKGNAFITGRIGPRYRHHAVALQRRTCAKCRWKFVQRDRTNTNSRWRFKLSRPKSGRFYYRVRVPESPRNLQSFSGVWYTWRAKKS